MRSLAAALRPGPRVMRFLVVGLSNVAISFTIYHLCYRAAVGAALLDALPGVAADPVGRLLDRFGASSVDGGVANAIGYAAGTVNSFVWNRSWTFGVVDRARRRFVRFLALNVAGLFFSSAAIFATVDVVGLPYAPAWFVVGVLVTAGNYLGNRFWVFGDGVPTGESVT